MELADPNIRTESTTTQPAGSHDTLSSQLLACETVSCDSSQAQSNLHEVDDDDDDARTSITSFVSQNSLVRSPSFLFLNFDFYFKKHVSHSQSHTYGRSIRLTCSELSLFCSSLAHHSPNHHLLCHQSEFIKKQKKYIDSTRE